MRALTPLLTAFLIGPSHAQEPTPPNIVLLLADDQGWGDASYQGHPTLKTPHLDAMARRGLRLDRFYASSPVCSPTRASCLTGRHPFRYGITHANRGHLPERETTLAELLRARGFATGHFGKWHLGTLTTEERDSNRGAPANTRDYAPPWEHGFETCFSTEAKVPTFDPRITPDRLHGGVPKNRAPGEPYGTAYWVGPGKKAAGPLRGDDSALLVDHALTFLDAALDEGRPFFAVIWFHAPHLPVVADAAHRAAYAGEEELTQHYYGCLAALDEQVGRLHAHLVRRGAHENTWTFYASDNGPEGREGEAPGSSGGLRGRKRSLYEGGVRVPAIVTWPAVIEAGRTSDVPASTLDYLPTICAGLGIDLPDDVPRDGIDLLPLLRGERRTIERALHFAHADVLVRTESRFKLLGTLPRDHDPSRLDPDEITWELYDLLEDPAERIDRRDAHPERVRDMAAALLAWRADCEREARRMR